MEIPYMLYYYFCVQCLFILGDWLFAWNLSWWIVLLPSLCFLAFLLGLTLFVLGVGMWVTFVAHKIMSEKRP